MIDKTYLSVAEAVADIPDGATVMVGGFGASGSPIELLHALIDQGATDLTVINNNTGNGDVGLAALIGNGQVQEDDLLLSPVQPVQGLSEDVQGRARSSSRSSRRGPSPSGFAREARGFRRSSLRPRWARSWPRARSRGSSTGAPT